MSPCLHGVVDGDECVLQVCRIETDSVATEGLSDEELQATGLQHCTTSQFSVGSGLVLGSDAVTAAWTLLWSATGFFRVGYDLEIQAIEYSMNLNNLTTQPAAFYSFQRDKTFEPLHPRDIPLDELNRTRGGGGPVAISSGAPMTVLQTDAPFSDARYLTVKENTEKAAQVVAIVSIVLVHFCFCCNYYSKMRPCSRGDLAFEDERWEIAV